MRVPRPVLPLVLALAVVAAPARALIVPVLDSPSNASLASAISTVQQLVAYHRQVTYAMHRISSDLDGGALEVVAELAMPAVEEYASLYGVDGALLADLATGRVPTWSIAAEGFLGPGLARLDAELAGMRGSLADSLGGEVVGALFDSAQMSSVMSHLPARERLDALPLDRIAAGAIADRLAETLEGVETAMSEGVMDGALYRPGELAPLPEERTFTALGRSLGSAFEEQLERTEAQASSGGGVDRSIRGLAERLSLHLERPQEAAKMFFPGVVQGVELPLTLEGEIGRLSTVLPIGSVDRALFRCAVRGDCESSVREALREVLGAGRGHSTALGAYAQYVDRIDGAGSIWGLQNPGELSSAQAKRVRVGYRDAAVGCAPGEDLPVADRVGAVPITSSGGSVPIDRLYVSGALSQDGRQVVEEHGWVRGARQTHHLATTFDVFAVSVRAQGAADVNRRSLDGLGERVKACGSLTCELRVLADVVRIEADETVRGAELLMEEMRFAQARIVLRHGLRRP